MYCIKCGHKNKFFQNYCINCGNKIKNKALLIIVLSLLIFTILIGTFIILNATSKKTRPINSDVITPPLPDLPKIPDFTPKIPVPKL